MEEKHHRNDSHCNEAFCMARDILKKLQLIKIDRMLKSPTFEDNNITSVHQDLVYDFGDLYDDSEFETITSVFKTPADPKDIDILKYEDYASRPGTEVAFNENPVAKKMKHFHEEDHLKTNNYCEFTVWKEIIYSPCCKLIFTRPKLEKFTLAKFR